MANSSLFGEVPPIYRNEIIKSISAVDVPFENSGMHTLTFLNKLWDILNAWLYFLLLLKIISVKIFILIDNDAPEPFVIIHANRKINDIYLIVKGSVRLSMPEMELKEGDSSEGTFCESFSSTNLH